MKISLLVVSILVGTATVDPGAVVLEPETVVGVDSGIPVLVPSELDISRYFHRRGWALTIEPADGLRLKACWKLSRAELRDANVIIRTSSTIPFADKPLDAAIPVHFDNLQPDRSISFQNINAQCAKTSTSVQKQLA